MACFSCLTPFPRRDPTVPGADSAEDAKIVGPKGMSESARYGCEVCEKHFCIDCDVYAHEKVHNCPGCQSDTRYVAGGDAMEE